MFQPSHFQKMAKHLGIDSLSYEKEYNGFMAKLKNFHESKGTPFRRLPWLGGQYLDLYLLYRKVTSAGGWVKVTEGKMWRDIAEVFNLPQTCTNAAFALRQHYSRYLESFERINFFGEDAEDVLSAGRPHTPVGGGTFPIHVPSVTTSDYISVISSSKDPSRNFDKLVLSLQCGMPNEVDFAINICMLLSNVSNSVFNLSKAPAVVDTLLAHVGVFSEDLQSLRGLHDQWYFKQDMERDFVKFWKDSLRVKEVQELLCGSKGEENNDEESLFHPTRRKCGAKDVECQRISQVSMILYNFSFDDTNAGVLAGHPLCLRFLVLCICSDNGFLQRMAWETLSNLAEKMLLEPIESSTTQMFFQMLHFFLDHKDRYHVTNAMDVLGKLCTLEGNDEVVEACLEPEAYQSLIKVLIVNDVQLVLSSLESLYNLSGVGQVTSNHIAEVHHSIDVLVCLVTMDAESFGPEALSEVYIFEKRIPAAIPATPKPQPTPVPVQQQPKETVVQHQAPQPSSPSSGPVQSPSPQPVPVKTTGSEIDPEAFTYNWLQGTYETSPGSSVSRIDIYADYLSSCSRLARVGILNATAFNRIIKMAFPDGQLRRVQSGVNVQYVLAGIKRRANPLPVKSRTDSPAVSQQSNAASPHPPVQRMPPGQQSIPRTPTSPAPNQMNPAWNPPRQQSVGGQQQKLMQRAFDQRSTSVPMVNQQQQQQQQLPGVSQVLRRPSFSSQGTIQTTSDQGMQQFPAVAMQQQKPQTAADPRQVMVGQMQRSAVPSGKEQFPDRQAVLCRASAEGMNVTPNQNPQSLQQHIQGQTMQRVPLPPQSPGPPRDEHVQQIARPVQSHRIPQTVPISPIQRAAPQPAAVGIPVNVHSPQSTFPRSSLPPPRPLQPPIVQPSQTPPPTGFVPRSPTSIEPSPYRSTATHRQPAPPYSQLQNIRPAPPSYNSRPAYHGSYPPLAPKPAPGMNVQLTQQSQARNQVPSGSTAAAGIYPGSPQVPNSTPQRQNFQRQSPPSNLPPSPLLSSSMEGRLPFASSQQDLPGGYAGRSIRPKVAQDSRQANKEPLMGRRAEGVVLIAQEERAADVVSTGLIEGAEEQKIIVIENKNRTETRSTKGEVSNHSSSTQLTHNVTADQVEMGQNSRGEICGSNVDVNVEKPLGKLAMSVSEGEKNAMLNSTKTTFHTSNNGSLKRDLNAHVMHVSGEENLNCQSEDCGPVKRPRLDKRMSSLENELDNSSSIPSRTGSPTPLVNGDIKGDSRNKLMDKLLDKDLRLPLNGVCGIDASELDLLASDGERLSSSKASSPDLFGSETNSDFGKYLEESDTDTGLFSDVLQGDLRIDPMENGTEGTHPVTPKMPVFSAGSYNDSIPNETGVASGIAEQQGKIPIPPTVRPEPQRPHEGALPGQYNATVNRNAVAVNAAWNSTNTVTQGSKAGYGPQRFAPDIQQKMSVYPQQGNLSPHVGNRSHIENKRGMEPQVAAMQKPAFQHQNIQSNPQQVTAVQNSSAMHPSGLPQNALPAPQIAGVVNSMVPGIRGSGMQQPSSAPPPYPGGQHIPAVQTSLARINADGGRGMQPPMWSPSSVQQKQVPVAPHAGPRTEPGTQNVGPAGFQVSHSSMPVSQVRSGSQNVSGWQAQYPDVRTHSTPTQGAPTYDATAMSQGRQPSALTPPPYQHPSLPPAGKNLMPSPGPMAGSPEFAATPPGQGKQGDAAGPQVVSYRPYRCRWATCCSSFDTSKSLLSHVVNEHVPRDSLVMSCMWEGCPPVRRSRSSLLFHLQQKHSEPSPVPSAPPPQPPPVQHQPPPQSQAQSQAPPTSFVPAYHFLARMLQSLQGEEESPLTKSVRLTAALVLRNVAQYSALARSMLRRHESNLSLVAMSNSEAAHAVAACLSELSPHRKASSDDSDTFIWALNR